MVLPAMVSITNLSHLPVQTGRCRSLLSAVSAFVHSCCDRGPRLRAGAAGGVARTHLRSVLFARQRGTWTATCQKNVRSGVQYTRA